MTSYLGSPPAVRVIPVTRGADVVFTLRLKDSAGAALDWDGQVYVDVDIDKTAPTRVGAVVSGADAAVRIESDIADLVKNSTRWRAIRSTAGTPTLETAVVVGTFERFD